MTLAEMRPQNSNEIRGKHGVGLPELTSEICRGVCRPGPYARPVSGPSGKTSVCGG